jgi:hypothetical protein
MNAINSRRYMGYILLKFIIQLVSLSFICGCVNGIPPQQYVSYFEANESDFCRIIKRNGVVAKALFLPKEYLVAREMAFDSSMSMASIIARYDSTLYFRVSFWYENGSMVGVIQRNENTENSGYRNNLRKEDAFILVGKDTVHFNGVKFDKTYGTSSEIGIVLTFPAKNIIENKRTAMLFVNNTFVELGTLSFDLKKIIKPMPALRG